MAQVDDNTIRFSTAVMRGNLRLLIGMVRANHPWRVTVKLSRALVAALGTAAYVLASSGFWMLASYMTWPRLLGLALAALVTTSVALIAAHDLWEHGTDSHTRERVVLFNAVTALTIAIGVLTLYLALLAFSVVGSFSLIPEGALNAQTPPGRPRRTTFGLRGWRHRSRHLQGRWARWWRAISRSVRPPTATDPRRRPATTGRPPASRVASTGLVGGTLAGSSGAPLLQRHMDCRRQISNVIVYWNTHPQPPKYTRLQDKYSCSDRTDPTDYFRGK